MAKYPPPGAPGFSVLSMDPAAIKRRKEIYQEAMETKKRDREEEREQETLQSAKRVRRASNASMLSVPFTNLNKAANSDNNSSIKGEHNEEVATRPNRPVSHKTLPNAIPVKQKKYIKHKRALAAELGDALMSIGRVWKSTAATMRPSELDAVLELAFPLMNQPKRVGRPPKAKEGAKDFANKLFSPLNDVLGPVNQVDEEAEETEEVNEDERTVGTSSESNY